MVERSYEYWIESTECDVVTVYIYWDVELLDSDLYPKIAVYHFVENEFRHLRIISVR